MKRRKTSLFHKLILGYVSLCLLIIVSFVFSLNLFMFLNYRNLERTIGDISEIIQLTSSDPRRENLLVDADHLSKENHILKSDSCWLELLDEHWKIIDVIGSKKDSVTEYSVGDLHNLTQRSGNKYYGEVYSLGTEDGKIRYCILKIEKDVFNFKFVLSREGSVVQIINEVGNNITKLVSFSIIFFILLIILNTVLMSRWIHNKIKRPIMKLAEGFSRVQAGEYSTQIECSKEREFAYLEQSFNDMAAQLNDKMNELTQTKKNENLMLLNLSHDIRTPLSSIKGYIYAFRHNMIEPAKKEDYYHIMEQKVDHITELTSEMFDLLKFENEELLFEKNEEDLFEFIRGIAAFYYTDITEAGMDFEVNIPETEYIYAFNSMMLHRAIGNIISNSIKYSETATTIFLSANEKRDEGGCYAEIYISDNGVGISPEIGDEIFEKFVTGDNSRSKNGTGLGLSISKAIIEKHNGTIECINASLGAAFKISFQKKYNYDLEKDSH